MNYYKLSKEVCKLFRNAFKRTNQFNKEKHYTIAVRILDGKLIMSEVNQN
jgi:hypothetical protein